MKQLSISTKNILGAAGTRLVSMAIAIFSVPILLQLISKDEYGTWVTLTSLLAWIAMLDLGVGNSLRNSVAEMLDSSQAVQVQHEFISFFHLLSAIAVLAVLVLCGAVYLVPLLAENRGAALILYVPVLLLLPFLLSASVLQGARAVGLQSLLQSTSSWLFFLFIAVCYWTTSKPGLTQLAFAWSSFYAFSLFVMLFLALRTLKIPFSKLFHISSGAMPTARIKVGLSFLLLQISSLVLYSLGNTIIYGHLGSEEVARYDVANKIFQVGLGFYTVVIGVSWSEISRLRALGEFQALRATYKKLIVVALIFSSCAFMIAYFTPWIVRIWTANSIQLNKLESFSIAALVSVQSIAYVGAVFLNAFEKIRVQIALAGVSIILMIPVSKSLLLAGLGITAVPLAAGLLTLLPLVLCNIKAISLLRSNPQPYIAGSGSF